MYFSINFQSKINYQLSGGNVGTVVELVLVGGLPGTFDEDTIVGTHPAVDHANVVGDLLNLEDGVLLVQQRLVLLLGGKDNAVGGLQADRGCSGGHCCQCILNLNQFAGRAEMKREKVLKLNSGVILRSRWSDILDIQRSSGPDRFASVNLKDYLNVVRENE